MPIRIKCKCGKTLSIPDAMAGKAVKCPGCGQALRVPGGGGAGGSGASGSGSGGAAAAAKKPAPAPKAASEPESPFGGDGGMSDLFDEEGFSSVVEAVCPVCRAEMAGNAVLCTKCGYHKETGSHLEAHKTAGVDIDHGTLALEKAANDMVREKAMQAKLVKGGGMPWWALALVLFMIGSGLAIAVLAVNASRRIDEEINFDPIGLFLLLAGCAFYAASQGAFIMIVVHAFKQSVAKGLLAFFVPFYILYHVATNWRETWRFFVASIVLSLIGLGLFIGAAIQSGS